MNESEEPYIPMFGVPVKKSEFSTTEQMRQIAIIRVAARFRRVDLEKLETLRVVRITDKGDSVYVELDF